MRMRVARAVHKRSFPIVGIGASAGGFEAFRRLLSQLPRRCGAALVLVTHLSPEHESALTTLLSRLTPIPVSEIQDGMAVEPDHVYVMPPNVNVRIQGMRLRLARRRSNQPHLPIDGFFHSLAEEAGSRAIGVVLSGTASDGVLGLKTIKAAGGITFAQEIKSAKYPEMPRSAVESGYVDLVLSPEGIAGELARISRNPYLLAAHAEGEQLSGSEQALSKLLSLLRSAFGVDFTRYKPEPLKRRIRRRMVLLKLRSLKQYVRYAETAGEELDALHRDLLMNVTGFFRDAQAFEKLKTEFLPRLAASREPGAPLRIWVPGCSTGEEAYSLAICVAEFLGQAASARDAQIFATDLSEATVEEARAGVYPANIEEQVSPERLRRFFMKTPSGYRVCKTIRGMCIFARQDALRDPPLSKIDLISCRNVLMYLKPAAREEALRLFHYALRPGGVLLLGHSETAGAPAALFAPGDRRCRIYLRRSDAAAQPRVRFGRLIEDRLPATDGAAARAGSADVQKQADHILLSRFAPAGVLVDRWLNVVQFRGRTGAYLEPRSGRPGISLARMACPSLMVVLNALLDKAWRRGVPARKRRVRVRTARGAQWVNLEVIPIRGPAGGEQHALILFEPARPAEVAHSSHPATGAEPRASRAGAPDQQISLLKEELRQSERAMETLVEEYDAAAEELRTANEEALSSNEELQATVEELETAKEELQSTAENLAAMNAQIQASNQALSALNSDLENVLESVALPVLIVDEDLRVRRFTRSAAKLLNLESGDVGRPVSGLKPNFEFSRLDETIAGAKNELVLREVEMQDRLGRWYAMRARPYKKGSDQIGAVITWTDITALKLSLQESAVFAQAIVDSARESLLLLDAQLRVKTANRTFYEVFGVSPKETEGRLLYELGSRQWDVPRLRSLLEDILPRQSTVRDFSVVHDFPKLGRREMLLNARRIVREGEPMILLAIEDVTPLEQARDSLRVLSARFSEVQQQERQRLARELHDTTSSNLVELAMALAQLVRRGRPLDAESREILARATDLAHRCSREVRTLSYLMHPPAASETDMLTALRWYVEGFAERSGIPVDLHLPAEAENPPRHLAMTVFRVVQESLSNIHRHSGSSTARLSIARNNGMMTVEISDSGRGMPAGVLDTMGRPGGRSGAGLMGMAERVQEAGGRLQIHSGDGGTTVRASLPLGAAASA